MFLLRDPQEHCPHRHPLNLLYFTHDVHLLLETEQWVSLIFCGNQHYASNVVSRPKFVLYPEHSFQSSMENCSQCISDLYCRRQSCRWVPFCGFSLQPWECKLEGVILLRSLRSMSIVFGFIIHCLQAAWSQLGEYGVFCLWKDIGGIRIRLNSWCWKHPAPFSLSDQINSRSVALRSIKAVVFGPGPPGDPPLGTFCVSPLFNIPDVDHLHELDWVSDRRDIYMCVERWIPRTRIENHSIKANMRWTHDDL